MVDSSKALDPDRRPERVLRIAALMLALVVSACTKYRVAPSDDGGGDAVETDAGVQSGSGGFAGTGGTAIRGAGIGGTATGGTGIGGTPDAGRAETSSDAPADRPADTSGSSGNGAACQTYLQCASGNCTNGICCGAGQSGCDGGCLNLSTDNVSCGMCGNICVSGKETCTSGSCKRNDGQPCTMSAQCVSGVCTLFFVDADGDHYGAGTASAGFCTITSPPLGYATLGGDCCDSNPAVNPGVAGFPQTAAPTCPGGTMVSPWDYNCDGVVEPPNSVIAVSCGPAPNCAPIFPEGSCGTVQMPDCECFFGPGVCFVSCASGPASPIGCH
jgi:hypothetical protein